MQGYLKKYTLKEGDIDFDCGAYCGETAYVFSELVGPTGKVFAFEPDDLNYQALLQNIEKQNLQNVMPVKKGIYSRSGILSFVNEGALGSAILDHLRRTDPDSPKIKNIEVISLSDAYQEFNLPHLDFVKMDIEGAEIDVIEGAKNFLRDKNINFAIASYHLVDGKPSWKYLQKIFREIGYEYETGYPEHLTTWAAKSF